jgi:hypothetical protein
VSTAASSVSVRGDEEWVEWLLSSNVDMVATAVVKAFACCVDHVLSRSVLMSLRMGEEDEREVVPFVADEGCCWRDDFREPGASFALFFRLAGLADG